jgi:hypothetical protein
MAGCNSTYQALERLSAQCSAALPLDAFHCLRLTQPWTDLCSTPAGALAPFTALHSGLQQLWPAAAATFSRTPCPAFYSLSKLRPLCASQRLELSPGSALPFVAFQLPPVSSVSTPCVKQRASFGSPVDKRSHGLHYNWRLPRSSAQFPAPSRGPAAALRGHHDHHARCPVRNVWHLVFENGLVASISSSSGSTISAAPGPSVWRIGGHAVQAVLRVQAMHSIKVKWAFPSL